MLWEKRYQILYPLMLMAFGIYLSINYFTASRAIVLPLTAVDDFVPFIAWTLPIYLTVFVQAFLFPVLIADVTMVKKYLFSGIIVCLICFSTFVIFPTQYAYRPSLENENWFWSWCFSVVYQLDKSTNCFPSFHVAAATLYALLMFRNRKMFILFAFWSLAIAISTLTTNQHYFYDLPSGALVALFAWYIAEVTVQ